MCKMERIKIVPAHRVVWSINGISRNAFNLYHLVFITSLTSVSWFWDCSLPAEESGLHEEYFT